MTLRAGDPALRDAGRAPVVLPALALALAAAMAGCAGLDGSTACQDVAVTKVVDEVRGTDIVVDDGTLVLHAAEADVFVRTPESCQVGTLADVRAGSRIGHDATAIAESYPAQAWPDVLVVEAA